MLLTIDPHGPNAFRVDGPFGTMEPFAKAFGCKAGDPMVRPDSLRVQIW
jgi:putative endopeptidase